MAKTYFADSAPKNLADKPKCIVDSGYERRGQVFSTDDSRPMNSLTGSEHSSRSSEAKLFGIEFSYLHVSKEDSIEPRCDQLDSQATR